MQWMFRCSKWTNLKLWCFVRRWKNLRTFLDLLHTWKSLMHTKLDLRRCGVNAIAIVWNILFDVPYVFFLDWGSVYYTNMHCYWGQQCDILPHGSRHVSLAIFLLLKSLLYFPQACRTNMICIERTRSHCCTRLTVHICHVYHHCSLMYTQIT